VRRYPKCNFPPCEGNVLPGKHNFCAKHQDMANFFIFMMENIKVADKKVEDATLLKLVS
jgi:hypothetical protein